MSYQRHRKTIKTDDSDSDFGSLSLPTTEAEVNDNWNQMLDIGTDEHFKTPVVTSDANKGKQKDISGLSQSSSTLQVPSFKDEEVPVSTIVQPTSGSSTRIAYAIVPDSMEPSSSVSRTIDKKRKRHQSSQGRQDPSSSGSVQHNWRGRVQRRSGARARMSSPSPPALVEDNTERHPDFWHPDGSIVVKIGGVTFKLHRSLLTQHSPKFAELVRKSAAGSDLVEGCSTFTISSVSAEDFTELLTALERGVEYVLNPPAFPALSALLRAAHTLQFATLERYASQRLREMWPAKLEYLSPARIPHAIDSILLARACGIPELLKRAFYELLRTPKFGQGSALRNLRAGTAAAKACLEPSDVLHLVAAREELLQHWVQITRAPPSPSVMPCPLEELRKDNPDVASKLAQCRQARAGANALWFGTVKQGAIFEKGLYDPLCGLDCLLEMDWDGMGYCDGCIGLRKGLWTQKKAVIWEELDQLLPLPIGGL